MKSLDSSSNISIAGRDRIKYLALLDPGSTEDNTVLFSNVVGKEHKPKVQMLIPPAIVTQWNPKMTCVETAKTTLAKALGDQYGRANWDLHVGGLSGYAYWADDWEFISAR